jgi:hypothetical protein
MLLPPAVDDQGVCIGEEYAVAIDTGDVDLLAHAEGDRWSARIENVHARSMSAVGENE